MNEELKRIRERDFSDIDDKLYENLERTDNLTSALSHLSDFQRFLMEQIGTLNSGKSNPLAKSIAKNFDNLRHSLVRQSKIKKKQPNSKKALNILMGNVKVFKQDLDQLKGCINKESQNIYAQLTQIFQDHMGQVLQKFKEEQEKNQEMREKIKQLQKKNIKLEEEKQKIMKQNAILKETKQKRQLKTPRYSQPLAAEACRTPLKDNSKLYNLVSGKQWKLYKEQPNFFEQKNNSYKTLCGPVSKLTEKQNSILQSKGGREMSRGRSRQKIKVFSML